MEILHTKSRFLPLINMETSGNQESIFLLEIITMSSGCRQQFVRYSMCPFLISFLFSVTCQLHSGSHTPASVVFVSHAVPETGEGTSQVLIPLPGIGFLSTF